MNRSGFTLVELMASLAISAMLLVSVMGLTARLSTASRIIRENNPVVAWKEVLQHRLESDYRNARSIVVRSNEIIIQGQGTPDWIASEDGYLLPVPMQIVYSILTYEEVSLLIRTVQVAGFPAPDNRKIDFICQGIVGFGTDQPLATDVAPGTIGLQIYELNSQEPIRLSLVRHGMPE